MVDISERETVQRQRTSVATPPKTQPQKIEAPLEEIGSFLQNKAKVEAAAKKQADTLRLTKFKNDYDLSVTKGTAHVMSADGENVAKAHDDAKTGLDLQRGYLLKEMPADLQEKAGLYAGRANIRFTRASLSRSSTELDKVRDSTFKARGEQLTQQAVYEAWDQRAFDIKMEELSDAVVEYDEQKGVGGYTEVEGKLMPTGNSVTHVKTAQSNMVLQSIKGLSSMNAYSLANKFYKNNEHRLNTADHGRAKIEIAKAEDKHKTVIAGNNAAAAFEMYRSNPKEAASGVASIKDPVILKRTRDALIQKLDLVSDAERATKIQNLSEVYTQILEKHGAVPSEVLSNIKDPEDQQKAVAFGKKVRSGKLNETSKVGRKTLGRLISLSYSNPREFMQETESDRLNGHQLEIGNPGIETIRKRRTTVEASMAKTSKGIRKNASESKIRKVLADVLRIKKIGPDDEGSDYLLAVGQRIYEDVLSEVPPDATQQEIERAVRARYSMTIQKPKKVGFLDRLVGDFVDDFSPDYFFPDAGKYQEVLTIPKLTESFLHDGIGSEFARASQADKDFIREAWSKKFPNKKPTREQLQKGYTEYLRKRSGLDTRIEE